CRTGQGCTSSTRRASSATSTHRARRWTRPWKRCWRRPLDPHHRQPVEHHAPEQANDFAAFRGAEPAPVTPFRSFTDWYLHHTALRYSAEIYQRTLSNDTLYLVRGNAYRQESPHALPARRVRTSHLIVQRHRCRAIHRTTRRKGRHQGRAR